MTGAVESLRNIAVGRIQRPSDSQPAPSSSPLLSLSASTYLSRLLMLLRCYMLGVGQEPITVL